MSRILFISLLVNLSLVAAASAASEYENSFHKALNYKCKGGYYRVSSTGAEDVAGAVSSGRYELNDFLNIYYQTCDFDQSARIAEDANKRKSDVASFQKALRYKCRGGYYNITASGAETIATGIAANKYSLNDVLNTYYQTCDFDQAIRIAEDVAKKTTDLSAFDKSLYYKCKGGYYKVSAQGAEGIAKAVAANKVDVNDVLSGYYGTCDYDQAVRVAEDVNKRKSDLAAFQKALNYKCKGGYYKVTAVGAEELAKEVAKSSIDLNSFLDMYYSTCEYDRSLRMAKSAKSSGGSSDDDGGTNNSGSAL